MFDTHCHLTDSRLLEQLPAVLARAAAAGVTRMVTIGTHLADWREAIRLCHMTTNRSIFKSSSGTPGEGLGEGLNQSNIHGMPSPPPSPGVPGEGVSQLHPNLRCAIGIDPHQAHQAGPDDLALLRELAADPSVVAIGEAGLEYHYDVGPRDRQRELLEAQAALAAELDFPMVIHCREAVDDCLAILGRFRAVHAVFHCFTGTAAEADRIFAAGYLLGLGGIATFRNADSLRQIAAAAPADRILLETDAPYLSPEPMRRQRINEPALVVHTANAVAKARGISTEELDRQTTGNANRFYRWPS